MPIYISNKDNLHPLKVLGEYIPWSEYKRHGGSEYPQHSKDILDFKDNYAAAISKFYNKINPLLADNFAICVVPSHAANVKNGPLYNLCDRLSRHPSRINSSTCLNRFISINKLAQGGDRAVQVHLESIEIRTPLLIRNKNILLLDDVLTTGNSLEACKKILLDAGANKVRCLALGKTTYL